jgi:hypothetical protein
MKTNVLDLKLGALDLYKTADDVIQLSKHMIGNKDIKLVNKIDRKTPKVEADEARVQQVFNDSSN